MTQINYHDRIVSIPGIVGGKPIIKGTRIPVEIVLQHLAYNLNLETLFADYPDSLGKMFKRALYEEPLKKTRYKLDAYAQ